MTTADHHSDRRASAPIAHSRPLLDASDLAAVAAVLRSGHISAGPQVDLFERAVARHVGGEAALATSSGTSALAAALRILDVGVADEVIVPTYVCAALRAAVYAVGATPVYCDSGPDWNLTAETVSRVVTPRTKAVVAVHLFGIAADSLALRQLGIPVIDDCCQALPPMAGHVAPFRDSLVVLSFHATKCLAAGEGGMVIGDAARLTALRDMLLHKAASSPMTDMQAALGISQLGRYASFLERRRELAERYFAGLNGLPIHLPVRVAERSIFFRFPVSAPGYDFHRLQAAFLARGVHVRRGVDALLHREAGLPDTAFAQAVAHFRQTVSLPLYPALTDYEQDRVVAAAREVFRS